MQKWILCFIIVVMLVACERKTEHASKLSYRCDVESLAGWTNEITIEKRKAFTGEYVSKLDAVNPYSISFKMKTGAISPKPILRAEVSAWVYLNDLSSKGAIACVMDSSQGKPYVYHTESLGGKVKKVHEWTRISSVFYFPEKQSPEFLFSTYLWNTGEGEFYVDDLEVRFTEY